MQWLKLGKAELTSTLLALAVATHSRASQRLSYTSFSPAFLHQTSQRQGFLIKLAFVNL
jgi:hypothetical protein